MPSEQDKAAARIVSLIKSAAPTRRRRSPPPAVHLQGNNNTVALGPVKQVTLLHVVHVLPSP
jgi:hypothetical protein